MTTFPDFYAMTIAGDLLRDLPSNPDAVSVARKVNEYLSLTVSDWLYEAGLPEDTALDLTETRNRLIAAAWARIEADEAEEASNAYVDEHACIQFRRHPDYYANATAIL